MLDILHRVLDGTLYNVLPYQFHEERSLGGEYIPLRSRRPSVRYGLSRVVVEDSVSLLFSEGHFPTIDCAGTANSSICSCRYCERGTPQPGYDGGRNLRFGWFRSDSYESPAWACILSGVGHYLPYARLGSKSPDLLSRVIERYKVAGQRLVENGYEISNPDIDYWFERQWDAEYETMVHSSGSRQRRIIWNRFRTQRSDTVWILCRSSGCETYRADRQLATRTTAACTFRAAIETQIEIDYQLSQAGRGLKYSSDPTLLIKEPATSDGQIVKGAGNALVVSEKGDARLLEIGGTASAAVMEYVRTLRELALESVHGNRANADRLTAAQSGRALELMNQGLLWLADNLRVSYGETALLSLARMVVRASQIYPLQAMEEGRIPALDPSARLSIKWPRGIRLRRMTDRRTRKP